MKPDGCPPGKKKNKDGECVPIESREIQPEDFPPSHETKKHRFYDIAALDIDFVSGPETLHINFPDELFYESRVYGIKNSSDNFKMLSKINQKTGKIGLMVKTPENIYTWKSITTQQYNKMVKEIERDFKDYLDVKNPTISSGFELMAESEKMRREKR